MMVIFCDVLFNTRTPLKCSQKSCAITLNCPVYLKIVMKLAYFHPYELIYQLLTTIQRTCQKGAWVQLPEGVKLSVLFLQW